MRKMSEGKETNFFDKLKTDKKFRFEFIMAIWSGIVGIALVIGLVFVGKATRRQSVKSVMRYI